VSRVARPNAALALAASSLAFALVLLDTTVVNVALPAIRADLGATTSGLQWIVNGYTLALAALMLSAGALTARVGARRLLRAGVTIFAAGSVAATLAPSVGALVAAQVLLGIGAAALVPASLTLLTHAYRDPIRRARAIGIWATISAAGFAGGPVIGGILIDASGWRLLFALNLPIVVAIAVLLSRVEETERTHARGLDLPGQATAVLALGALVFAVIESRALGWTSPSVLAAFALAVASGTAFVSIERRSSAPMLPLSLLESRVFSASAAAGALVSFAVYSELFLLSLYFSEVRGLSALQTGLALAPQPAIFALAGIPSGRLVARIGPRLPLLFGGPIAALGAVVLSTATAATPYAVLVVGMVLFGFGAGAIIPAITNAVVGDVPADKVGIASAALNASRQTGGVLGVALLGGMAGDGAADLLHGLPIALAICAGALALIALIGARTVTAARPVAEPEIVTAAAR
jgi:DHA2 family methylenomycin A resistance protein-like MFS transporter